MIFSDKLSDFIGSNVFVDYMLGQNKLTIYSGRLNKYIKDEYIIVDNTQIDFITGEAGILTVKDSSTNTIYFNKDLATSFINSNTSKKTSKR